MKKKLISVFIILAMCMSFTTYSYALSEDDAQEIITSIATMLPDEVQRVIEENADLLDLDMSLYYLIPASKQNEVMEMIAGKDFTSVEELQRSFDEACVIICIKNSSSVKEVKVIIEAYADLIGYDKSLYLKVSGDRVAQMIMKERYSSIVELRYVIAEICMELVASTSDRPSSGGGSGGGSSGGGGGYGQFMTYTLTRDGEPIYEQPENGTPVKLVIKAVYMGEPEVTYAVAVYDDENRMKCVKLHKSESENVYESEFFEVDTEYCDDYQIKLFKLESLTGLKPLEEAEYSYFGIGEAVPEKEQEKDGVTAVRGYISNIYGDSFELNIIEKRAYGYWGVPVSFKEPVKIKGYTEELAMYRNMSHFDVTYNIIENADGTYELDSIDVDGEVVRFGADDIWTVSDRSVTVSLGDEIVTYMASEHMNFMYENLQDSECIFAWVKDGVVQQLYCYNYEACKVISVGGGMILLSNGVKVSAEYVSGTMPEKDDVVICDANNIIRVIEGYSGYFFEDYIIVDEKQYSTYYLSYNDELVDGQKCIVYLTPDNKYVKAALTDYSAMQMVVAVGAYIDSEGVVTLETDSGEIVLNDTIVFDGICYPADRITHIIVGPHPLLISDVGEVTMLKSMPFVYASDRGLYSAVTKTIDGYSIKNADIVGWVEDSTVYKGVKLENRKNYRVQLFSIDGSNEANLVIVEIADQTKLAEVKYITVIDVQPGVLTGYCDGERVEFGLDTVDGYLSDIRFGDVLSVSILDGQVVSYAKKLSPMELYYQDEVSFTNSVNGVAFAPVLEIVDGVIIIGKDNDDISKRCAYSVNENTDIYICDFTDNSIKKADLSDIFVDSYEFSGYLQSDWVTVEVRNYDYADMVVIYKNF